MSMQFKRIENSFKKPSFLSSNTNWQKTIHICKLNQKPMGENVKAKMKANCIANITYIKISNKGKPYKEMKPQEQKEKF